MSNFIDGNGENNRDGLSRNGEEEISKASNSGIGGHTHPPALEGGSKPKVPDGLVAGGIDPSQLRLSQSFAALAGVKKQCTTVPVRKPSRQEFVRTHPSPEYWLETAVLEFKEDRETYLVDPKLWHELGGELVMKLLIVTINRQGVVTIWTIRLPGEDGKHDEWNASALEHAQTAKTRWVRITANMSLGAYEVYEAQGDIPEPEWPDISFRELINIAFKGRWIDTLDHPAIRRLWGAA